MLLAVSCSPLNEIERVKRESKVKVCGNHLVNMLRTICSYKGNTKKRRKEKKEKPKKKERKSKKLRKKKKKKDKK